MRAMPNMGIEFAKFRFIWEVLINFCHQSKRSIMNILEEGEDRISNLPDDVLGLIFSYLTTKEAVRTSVLSKCWQWRWTANTYNVNIDDSEFLSAKNNVKGFCREVDAWESFFKFMQRVFLLSENVKEFRLSCKKDHDFSQMAQWISTILSGQVESIILESHRSGITLPETFFSCPSLKNMELKLPCTFPAPSHNLLPNLTTLNLQQVHISNKNSKIDVLQFSFPILETFNLHECRLSNVKSVEFYVPNLTKFISTNYHSYGRYNEVNDTSIKIVGAKQLDSFEIYGGFLNYRLSESQVSYACLKLSFRVFGMMSIYVASQIRMLLRELFAVEELLIQLFENAWSKVELPLIEYYKLEDLCVLNISNVNSLLELLHAMPFLKYLGVEMNDERVYNYNAVEDIPSCLSHYLEEVTFEGFTAKPTQLRLAAFVLKNGLKLKKAHFLVHGAEKDKVQRELSTYHRGSPCLELYIEFSVKNGWMIEEFIVSF